MPMDSGIWVRAWRTGMIVWCAILTVTVFLIVNHMGSLADRVSGPSDADLGEWTTLRVRPFDDLAAYGGVRAVRPGLLQVLASSGNAISILEAHEAGGDSGSSVRLVVGESGPRAVLSVSGLDTGGVLLLMERSGTSIELGIDNNGVPRCLARRDGVVVPWQNE